MPWNLTDYPTSMKNLDPLTRKKAIDIANALLKDGYPDDRAIPIAISQAEKWLKNATDAEKEAFRKVNNPQKDDPHPVNQNAKKLMDADVTVTYGEKNWSVTTKGATRASDILKKKEDAVKRGKEIAENKASRLFVYKTDGSLQEIFDYRKN